MRITTPILSTPPQAMNIADAYRTHCASKQIPFTHEKHVRPYDDTTLFCPAGMQQFKSQFRDATVKGKTVANIQPCIRLNDYDEMGDGTHLLYFKMIGLFSFRDLSLQAAVDFWMTFVQDVLKLKVDYVTLHPDKLVEWRYLYDAYNVEIRADPDCTWTDGTAKKAYCTEFYIRDIEIGNIVHPGGDCIDVGFGYERLDYLVNGSKLDDREAILRETIDMILQSGFKPGPTKQGSILRKLIRDYGTWVTDPKDGIIRAELARQRAQQAKYHQLVKAKKRHGKSKAWWMSTHGIDLDLVDTSEGANVQ